MCKVAEVLEEYWWNHLQSLEGHDLFKNQVHCLLQNNIVSIKALIDVCNSESPAQLFKFIQVHDNSIKLWVDENARKDELVGITAARSALHHLRRVIERTTICVVVALLQNNERLINAELLIDKKGGPHCEVLRELMRMHKEAAPLPMRLHSSHLGLTPTFIHGELAGNSVLAGMYDLTQRHRNTWHRYKFNICLIKVMNLPGDRVPPAGELLLVTQNNRSCFTHSICQIPPLVFSLCAEDLTANFRKFKEFELERLGLVVGCRRRPHSVAELGKKNLVDAEKANISRCIKQLKDAYCDSSEEHIVSEGRKAPYLSACLESETVAKITSGGTSHEIVIPSGLYKHSGVESITDFKFLERLWSGEASEIAKPESGSEPDIVYGMQVLRVAPDGHCLFASIALQAENRDVRSLRTIAARYILQNAQLIPDQADAEKYAVALMGMKTDILWGGQPEIIALSRVLNRRIFVHYLPNPDQPRPPTIFGDELLPPQPADIHVLFDGRHYDALQKPN